MASALRKEDAFIYTYRDYCNIPDFEINAADIFYDPLV